MMDKSGMMKEEPLQDGIKSGRQGIFEHIEKREGRAAKECMKKVS